MLNLRNEIRMQNLSDCPSISNYPRMDTNEDAESEFTTKYFDLPTRFMLKRNKSSDTFGSNLDNKTTCRLQRKSQQRLDTEERE